MKNIIKHALDELTKKNANWDIEASEYLETDNETGKESFDQLTEVLLQIVGEIRETKMTQDDLKQLFDDYRQYNSFHQMVTFVWNRISIYTDYSLLRDMCQSDIYKAQKIVDIIWDESIYRFNPYMTWKEKIGVDDNMLYEILTTRLNKFVARSVRYRLTYDAMVECLKKDSDLPDEMCKYISKKVDENMKELKINYILDRLMRLDDNVEALLNDELTEE